MRRSYAPATANRYLSAVRGALKAAWRLELVDGETMDPTIDVAPVRGRREQRGAVTREELAAVFQDCGKDESETIAACDAALLELLNGAGLRRSEAAALTVENISWDDCPMRSAKATWSARSSMPASTGVGPGRA